MRLSKDALLVTFAGGSLLALLFAAFCVPSIHVEPIRSNVSRVRGDQRALSMAIEAYATEHGILPPMVPLAGADVLMRDSGPTPRTLPSAFGMVAREGKASKVFDPFTFDLRFPFAYFEDGKGWILISPGPDRKYDIADPAAVYDGAIPQPSAHLLAGGPWTYDPTNGTVSQGDVWRVRER